jgi:hypothetical protein
VCKSCRSVSIGSEFTLKNANKLKKEQPVGQITSDVRLNRLQKKDIVTISIRLWLHNLQSNYVAHDGSAHFQLISCIRHAVLRNSSPTFSKTD